MDTVAGHDVRPFAARLQPSVNLVLDFLDPGSGIDEDDDDDGAPGCSAAATPLASFADNAASADVHARPARTLAPVLVGPAATAPLPRIGALACTDTAAVVAVANVDTMLARPRASVRVVAAAGPPLPCAGVLLSTVDSDISLSCPPESAPV